MKLEDLYRWAGRAMIALIAFFASQIYVDFKEVKTTLQQILIRESANSKRIDYIETQITDHSHKFEKVDYRFENLKN